MTFTKKFKELTYENVDIAGGKGASLGEMAQNNFSIPSGFVVLAEAFDRFLEETDLGVEIEAVLKKIKMKDIHSVEDASETIRDMIADTKFPKDIGEEIRKEFENLGAKAVAVRSSATAEDSSVASWAGELESYLNINEKGLLEAVKKCWSSLFTPRAIFYRYEKNLHDQYVSVAVVVQKMIQSDVSGITFTAHPVTNDRNQIVIEAGYGLGEAIVGGKITPDTYIINKSEIRNPKSETNSKSKIPNLKRNLIIDKNISEQKMMIVYGKNGTKETTVSKAKQEKQKLSDSQIIKIAEICQKIEKHYKKPQDIEWAIEKGKIYITQARPITTL
jgi:pyruvate, water dikinase